MQPSPSSTLSGSFVYNPDSNSQYISSLDNRVVNPVWSDIKDTLFKHNVRLIALDANNEPVEDQTIQKILDNASIVHDLQLNLKRGGFQSPAHSESSSSLDTRKSTLVRRGTPHPYAETTESPAQVGGSNSGSKLFTKLKSILRRSSKGSNITAEAPAPTSISTAAAALTPQETPVEDDVDLSRQATFRSPL